MMLTTCGAKASTRGIFITLVRETGTPYFTIRPFPTTGTGSQQNAKWPCSQTLTTGSGGERLLTFNFKDKTI